MAENLQHEDFGEKIGGAKKDLWKDRGLYVDDLGAMNEREAEKFVKKDNVRVTEQCLCQKDFNLFVTAKISHLRIHNTFVKSKTLH